ncbi:unnamed protein product [Candida verbasci]|uniref:Cytochrome P450 n=1 Tax=Candida verbasci TaxID=1227364 RepID=A0A9W4TS07_9ASCO|nr:unnamed protein product [Candida verbasci]
MLFLILIVIAYFIYSIVIPPRYPKIPTIPFYVSFLSSYTNLDQIDIYELYLREKLEKYGAVKIYFASRWNVLVSKPEYLLQVFKEDVYAKSGNHIKIPHSVLSTYTGDNVISANGSLWKLYREVVTPSIQFPDLSRIEENSNNLELKSGFVTDPLQKFALKNVGDAILGINLIDLHQQIKFIKKQIFKPFYLNFPIFDILRWRTKRRVEEFREEYGEMIKSGNKLAAKALVNSNLTHKQFLDNAIILMVAGHENPLLLMQSLLYVIAKYPDIQEKLKKGGPYVDAIIYETLRMFPPLGQIINRCTTKDVYLGNIYIPKGTYVGYHNLATGRDRNVWKDADTFNPDRWGQGKEIYSNYLSAKRSARLPAFHGRKRACLGEKFALEEVRQFLKQVAKYNVSLDAEWNEKFTPAGPISPLNLKIIVS